MRLVVDASVAVKWLVAEDGSEAAESLIDQRFELHAPRLLASEVSNALWRKARLGEIAPGAAGVLAATVAQMPVEWTDDEGLCADATRIAVGLDRPVYDSMYLALAHRIDARLVTADIRFVKALAKTEHGGAVVALSRVADELSA